jgi:anti-anti-sigma factor
VLKLIHRLTEPNSADITLAVIGALDRSSAAQFLTSCLKALEITGCQQLALDLGGVTDVDKDGLAALSQLQDAVNSRYQAFVLCNAPRLVTEHLYGTDLLVS